MLIRRCVDLLCPAQAKAINAKKQGLEWPNTAQLGDAIRAMVVCGQGQYKQVKQVFDVISKEFEVQVCKVNLKAAHAAFEEREIARLKDENPGLKLSQYKERAFKAWEKSPENPANQAVELS